MDRIDTLAIKESVDLVELARRYTELRPVASHEYAGPCPKCGGTDRFHVRPMGWFCRQCHDLDSHGWADAIELLQWIEGVDFKQACARLTSGAVMPVSPAPVRPVAKPQKPIERPQAWVERAAELVERAESALWLEEGKPGREYLTGRGLESITWQTYRIGYIAESPTAERAPAIVLPWYRQGRVEAVRFRYLVPPGDVKIKSLQGSKFGWLLYGGHAMDATEPGPERTLILCEGEINAMSLWQAANDTMVDVLSVGSESARLSDAALAYAGRYGAVLTWFDKREIADRVAAALPGAYALAMPDGRDANDLLQAGLLDGFLASVRDRVGAGCP